MKIIFHERFYEIYASEPAATAGRMESIVGALGKGFAFITPSPATDKDLRRVHMPGHIEDIKRTRELYEVSLLAAGGALMAADLAMKGEPAFGLIRPPGHHASPESCWGFCYFNNLAIAVEKLRKAGQVKKVLILDFDLHFGDGTDNTFQGNPEVDYFHPETSTREEFVKAIQRRLERAEGFDILAVSAGFDRHVDDWGGLLTTEDYRTIGALVKTSSQNFCHGRRFGVLEGGYNHAVLGKNVQAFLEGMA
ncbi:MAG: histone deacetylase family protein [Deltaproteobacteria bacterium]|nr:histone deacetylase family protein [Deltaproteobacteria bacterium]